MSLNSRIEDLWWSHRRPPLALRLLEPIYSFISDRHLQQRAKNPITPPLPLISVGNITAGGSGKTPFVLWLAEALQKKGYHPVILCRGDGGNNSVPRHVDPELSAIEAGDEARMLADLSGLPVITASDRITGSQMAAELGDIIILDDGFQYRHLQRECDIVLIPAEGVGNAHRIPAGPLREAVDTLDRADLVIRTGDFHAISHSLPLSDQHEWRWISQSDGLIDVMDKHTIAPESVYAATSIARPTRFFDSLVKYGLKLTATRSFPDHHQFTEQEVNQLLNQQHVAVTAKDAVKLKPLWPKGKPLWVLTLTGEGEPDLLEAILKYISKA